MSTDYQEGFDKGMEAARRDLKIVKFESFGNGFVVGLIVFYIILVCFTGC